MENGRSLAFANGKAYVSSYAGSISVDPKAPLGKVMEIDTISLSVTREAIVGYQPEEMAVVKTNFMLLTPEAIVYLIMTEQFLLSI